VLFAFFAVKTSLPSSLLHSSYNISEWAISVETQFRKQPRKTRIRNESNLLGMKNILIRVIREIRGQASVPA
jgi:hypothetical protein